MNIYIHTYIYIYIHTYTNAKEPSWVAVDPQYKFSLVQSLLHRVQCTLPLYKCTEPRSLTC